MWRRAAGSVFPDYVFKCEAVQGPYEPLQVWSSAKSLWTSSSVKQCKVLMNLFKCEAVQGPYEPLQVCSSARSLWTSSSVKQCKVLMNHFKCEAVQGPYEPLQAWSSARPLWTTSSLKQCKVVMNLFKCETVHGPYEPLQVWSSARLLWTTSSVKQCKALMNHFKCEAVQGPYEPLQVWSSARPLWTTSHWKTKALRFPQTSGNTTQRHGVTARNSWMLIDSAGRTQNMAVWKLTHDAWPQTICYDISSELNAPILYVTKKDKFLRILLLSIGSLSLPHAPSSPKNLFSCSTVLRRQALLSCETWVTLVNQWCDIL
jgi:hypothetical protein